MSCKRARADLTLRGLPSGNVGPVQKTLFCTHTKSMSWYTKVIKDRPLQKQRHEAKLYCQGWKDRIVQSTKVVGLRVNVKVKKKS